MGSSEHLSSWPPKPRTMPEAARLVQTMVGRRSQLGQRTASWASPQPTAIWAWVVIE